MEREREESKLTAILNEMKHLERSRQDLECAVQAAEESVAAAAPAIEELLALDAYRGFANRERVRMSQIETGLRSKAEAQRQLLVEAERRLEALNRLKERKFSDWRRELDKEQETLVAELVVARWGRRERGEA